MCQKLAKVSKTGGKMRFSQFSPFALLRPVPPFPLSSCTWVVHIGYLASPSPILFLISPCLFFTYQLCFLIPAPFPPLFPLPLPADNAPNDLRIYGSVAVQVVCLVGFWFCFYLFFLGSLVDCCEFVDTLIIIV